MKRTVIINTIKELETFISYSTKVSGDVLVHKDNYTVDGSSLMGLTSLGLSGAIIVEYPGNIEIEGVSDFDAFLKTIEV